MLPQTHERARTGQADRAAAGPRLQDARRALAARLAAAGVATPELDARLLLAAACGLSREAMAADPQRSLTAAEEAALDRLAGERLRRRPVARILGRREFWGRDFLLNDDTLDPRPDSETVVSAVLALLAGQARAGDPLRILDLGTGTGCLLLSLLGELPAADGVGIDRSEGALAAARLNAQHLGFADRAFFLCASWLDALYGRFDVVVANPPYVASGDIAGLAPEVGCHEPRLALDGGGDGLDAYRAIVPALGRIARPGALLVLELGHGQTAAVARLVSQAGLGEPRGRLRLWHDLAGKVRCLSVEMRPMVPVIEKKVGNSRHSR